MKNIIFIAPPAAGKGTQSAKLTEKYNYIHISTGDLLRSEIAEGTPLGKEIENIMASGHFVSDEIATEVLRKRLSKPDIANGFILDGYPRNVKQAEILDGIVKDLNISLDVAIYLSMDKTTAMHRALGRITCPNCNRGYNKYENILKPKNEWICDDCATELVSRSDDNEETFGIRFDDYVNKTEPLLDYYKEAGILKVIDNSGTPDETFKSIESVI
ncbi:MAG: adenylate kinase [Erysipelotrichales bacterium]|nr:adenylate kinase [Erysipelotrichales bacterium]